MNVQKNQNTKQVSTYVTKGLSVGFIVWALGFLVTPILQGTSTSWWVIFLFGLGVSVLIMLGEARSSN